MIRQKKAVVVVVVGINGIIVQEKNRCIKWLLKDVQETFHKGFNLIQNDDFLMILTDDHSIAIVITTTV